MALRVALDYEFDFALHFSSFHFNPFSGISLDAISCHFGSAVPLGIALFKNLRLFMERINFGRIFLCHFTRQSIKMGTHTHMQQQALASSSGSGTHVAHVAAH